MAKSNKRTSRKGQKRQLNILQSLFFIVVLFSAGYILLQSSVFSIRQIQVLGTQALSVSEVQRLSGIQTGVNTFKLNLKDVQERVALNPLVKTVEVNRSYPSTIVINLVERRSIALLPFNGEFLAVDDEGFYLTKVKDFSKANLPIITGIRLGNLTPGKQIVQEGLFTALKFIKGMDQDQLANLSEVNAADPEGIVLYTLNGVEARLGGDERIAEKLAMLKETLKNNYDKDIEYINISYEGKPVIKFVGDPADAAKNDNNQQGKD